MFRQQKKLQVFLTLASALWGGVWQLHAPLIAHLQLHTMKMVSFCCQLTENIQLQYVLEKYFKPLNHIPYRTT